MKKKTLLLTTLALCATLAVGCGGGKDAAQTPADATEATSIKIGVTGGPHETIMTEVAKVAKEQGIDLNVIVFSDYIQPNVQLAEGELDMNSMQHVPFFENVVAEKDYDLANIGENILIPMCILSEDYQTLDEIAEGALIGLPNDTTNLARALQLLETAGLITLKDSTDAMATTNDITNNPKNFKFQELEAGMLLRSLPEFGAAVINSNYVVEAGLVPNEEALYVESPENNPWVNIFACRSEDKDNADFQKLISIYQSDEIKAFIDETYNGAVIAAW